MKQILFIAKAYLKWVYDLIFDRISEKSINRYLICQKCKHKKFGMCKLCSCIVRVKCNANYIEDPSTGKTIAGCPAGKW